MDLSIKRRVDKPAVDKTVVSINWLSLKLSFQSDPQLKRRVNTFLNSLSENEWSGDGNNVLIKMGFILNKLI
jgi:hypothetical protein